MVSHELRTPLQAICGSVEILLARPQSEANLKTIRRLQNSALSLEALVKDLTDYIKLRSTKRLAERETVGMASLLAEVLDPLREKIAAKRIAIAQQVEPHDLTIRSDRKLLRQVLSNLIENSVKYTLGGSIDVSITLADAPAGQQLKIAVRDTAPASRSRTCRRSSSRSIAQTTRSGCMWTGSAWGLPWCAKS